MKLSNSHKGALLFIATFYSDFSYALTDIAMPTTAGGFFAGIEAFMLEIYTFMTGPFGVLVSALALGMAAMVWAIGARSEEGLGKIGRVTIAALILLNIPGLLGALKLTGNA